MMSFRARRKHQQQQAEPVHKAEEITTTRTAAVGRQLSRDCFGCARKEVSEQRWTDDNTSADLADHSRLVQLFKQVGKELGRRKKDEENNQECSERSLRHSVNRD